MLRIDLVPNKPHEHNYWPQNDPSARPQTFSPMFESSIRLFGVRRDPEMILIPLTRSYLKPIWSHMDQLQIEIHDLHRIESPENLISGLQDFQKHGL